LHFRATEGHYTFDNNGKILDLDTLLDGLDLG
jgi:hypothetical protein